MNRPLFLIFPVLLMCSLTINAQNARQQSRIQDIRTLWTKTLELIEMNSSDEETTDLSLHLRMNRMVPASGMLHYTVDAYIADVSEEESGAGRQEWRPYFIRFKYNFSAQEYQSECLLDAFSGKVVFIYDRANEYDGLSETRIYYNQNGSFCYAILAFTDLDGKKTETELKANSPQVKSIQAKFADVRDVVNKSLEL